MTKFHSDHVKILREGKTIADQFYKFPGLKNKEKKVIAGCCIQIASVEGIVTNVKLVDDELYVASRLGLPRLPCSQIDMRKARVLLERLFSLKKNIAYEKFVLKS